MLFGTSILLNKRLQWPELVISEEISRQARERVPRARAYLEPVPRISPKGANSGWELACLRLASRGTHLHCDKLKYRL